MSDDQLLKTLMLGTEGWWKWMVQGQWQSGRPTRRWIDDILMLCNNDIKCVVMMNEERRIADSWLAHTVLDEHGKNIWRKIGRMEILESIFAQRIVGVKRYVMWSVRVNSVRRCWLRWCVPFWDAGVYVRNHTHTNIRGLMDLDLAPVPWPHNNMQWEISSHGGLIVGRERDDSITMMDRLHVIGENRVYNVRSPDKLAYRRWTST